MLQHIWKCFLLHRTTTWPTDSWWNTILGFTSVSAFEKTFLSLHQTPPLLSLSYWPSVTVTVTTQSEQLSTWYVRQHSAVSNRVKHGKGKKTLFLIWQCSAMKRKQTHLKFPMNEMKKVTKITHQYVPCQCLYSLINVTFSCPCAHCVAIWERGGTTAHITNPTLLHTVPSDNILATIWSVKLPFSPQDFISYQNRWLFHSLHILVSLFVWVTSFLHNLPTQPGIKRDLGSIWMCVVSRTLHLHYPWGKCWVPIEQGTGWATDLAWSPEEVKNLLTLPAT